jgi:hypothetical protein
MTPATLHAWIKGRRLSHKQAAALLAESIHTLRKQIYGTISIGPQTVRIIELLDERAPLPSVVDN